jgi:hypothetical protein
VFDLLPEKSRFPSWLIKLTVISACVFGIGLGSCGLDAHLYPNSEFGGSALALIGAGLIALSVLGFEVVVLVLLVSLVTLLFPR